MTDETKPWFFFNGERLFRYATEVEARAHAAICLEKDRGAAVYDGYWMDEDITQTICWGRVFQQADPVVVGDDPVDSPTDFVLRDAGPQIVETRVREALAQIETEIGHSIIDLVVLKSYGIASPSSVAKTDGLVFARDLIQASLAPLGSPGGDIT